MATVPTTTARKMVEKWEEKHGPCSRMIKVDRDGEGKKICHEEKRHYDQDAIKKDWGNPNGNYLSIYLRHLQDGDNRVVCFDFDSRESAKEFVSCPLFKKLRSDGCLLGRTRGGCAWPSCLHTCPCD
jgi:hypothetical protein